MNNLSKMIKDIDEGKSVSINSYVFDKNLLNDLVSDLSSIEKLYPDKECQNFIHLYAIYTTHTEKSQLINYHNILIAFIIGFGGGVFVAGIITLIEQFIIRR